MNRSRARQEKSFLCHKSLVLVFLLFAMNLTALEAIGQEQGLLAWWKFEEGQGNVVLDSCSGIKDRIDGRFKYVPGVFGLGLKFDGFATCVVREANKAPRLSDAFTIEAWVALAAYPWNWCSIVSQEKNELTGYSLGVGPQGELGLKVSMRGAWQICTSQARIPLRRWSHVAGLFTVNNGLKIFLDGKEVGTLPVTGRAAFADGTDLLIGMNQGKQKPSYIVSHGAGTLPGWYSFDGIMDEIKIYNRAMSSKELEQAYEISKPLSSPDLPVRLMPSGPPGPGRFGAYYTKLKYYEEWDALWPVGSSTDIVVQFDDSPVRVVFWRGTRYSPAWVMENGLWMADQSVEAWDDAEGCYEHMQDLHCLYSQVRILENSESRVVIHWRYAPVSSRNHFWRVDEKTGWGLWVDEYYIFYPDQVGIRKVVWPKDFLGDYSQSEIQETIPLCQPGQSSEDVLNADALTLLNLKGERGVYSWPSDWDDSGSERKLFPDNPNIQVVNLKSRAKPFIIFEPGSRMHVYVGRVRKGVTNFPAYNHWPVSQMPSDGRYAIATDRVTSFSISCTDPVRHEGPESISWAAWLYGTTEGAALELPLLGRSWARAPELRLKGQDVISEGYDLSQRAYILSLKAPGRASPLEFELLADADSPVRNICLVIKGWGDKSASLNIDGNKAYYGRDYKIGRVRKLEGTDLVVWIKKESARQVRIALTPE